ncbi:hypothetical protein BH24ACT5_BH24ACT5_01440 [soil metagenome]
MTATAWLVSQRVHPVPVPYGDVHAAPPNVLGVW